MVSTSPRSAGAQPRILRACAADSESRADPYPWRRLGESLIPCGVRSRSTANARYSPGKRKLSERVARRTSAPCSDQAMVARSRPT